MTLFRIEEGIQKLNYNESRYVTCECCFIKSKKLLKNVEKRNPQRQRIDGFNAFNTFNFIRRFKDLKSTVKQKVIKSKNVRKLLFTYLSTAAITSAEQ